MDELWARDEAYWHQRSRVRWLNSCDKNNKFFHLSTIQRRQRNKIKMIKTSSGEWLDNDSDIAQGFTGYFKSLFSSEGSRDWSTVLNCVNQRVSSEMNNDLLSPISVEEVKAAVFQLGGLKAPGPDGFSGTFYQSYWEVVGSILSSATSDFFDGCKLLSSMNKTHIVLIPKVSKPVEFSQFRPISLCNFCYKIFSKVMANRLRSILPGLISHTQAAFVQERQIQDNIIIAHEVFHYLKVKRSSKEYDMRIKIDMNKAYNRVE